MKQTLFALCCLAAVGCSKTESFDTASTGAVIGFTNLNDRVAGRAANADDSNFGVYAVFADNGTFGADWFMNNIEVDGTTYAYAPAKFWPAAGALDFYAYAPASSAQLDLASVAYNGGTPALEATYTVAAAAAEDFTVAAAHTGVNHKASGDDVQFVFSHMLSQVKFEVAFDGASLDNTHYTLTVKNVVLDLPYDANTIGLNNQTWGNAFARSAGYAAYTGASNTGFYNVLPQTFSAANKAVVTASVEVKDNVTNEVYLDGALKPIELDGTSLAALEPGNSYLFKITVRATSKDENDQPIFTPISFSAGLNPWTDAGGIQLN